ncbi:MAG: polysaccharide biosynthesis/export family protein [Verrucomicrobiota bacterium]
MLPENPVAQTPVCLVSGDVIKLTFPGTPEYNQSQKIRPDGKISLPLVGEVQASGKKIGEFQTELSHLYETQLQNSEVVVAIENGASPVYVSGAVNHPGKILIDGPMTALEAIMEAGGFTQGLGDAKKVHLIRIENGHYTTHIIDLSPAMKGRTTVALYLKPKDVIFVPECLF